MKPIEFPQMNLTYAKNQFPYLPLPVYRTDDEATACWGMSWRERFRVLLTGRVYVTILHFGGPLAPSRVSVAPPTPTQGDT